MMRPKLRRSFAAAQGGAAAIEFALVAPLLITALLGAAEAFDLLRASGKIVAAANTIAELTAEGQNGQTTASLGSIVAAAQQILSPLPSTTLAVSIASIGYDANGKAMLLWQYSSGTGATVDLTKAAGLGSAGTSVIEASLVYPFTPMISAYVGAHTFRETALSRPRLVPEVTYNGKTQYP